jgi:hypothetical protein
MAANSLVITAPELVPKEDNHPIYQEYTMVLQPDHDFLLQLSSEVLRDAQIRVINASLLTNLALTSPISRLLAQTIKPFQMKAHWSNPSLEIAEGAVKLSVDVQGGARSLIDGINLSMEGEVTAKCQPTASVNKDNQPVITLSPPSPLKLHLGDLELTYEGDDRMLTPLGATIERALLRPTLCAELMAPLANLPLNYLPDMVPLHLTSELDDAATDNLALVDTAVSIDSHAESLTLAMRCAKYHGDPPPVPNLFTDDSTANVVVALSETALNRVLSRLCAQGLATGTTQHAHDSVSWRWAHAAVSFTDHTIHLTGKLCRDKTNFVVDSEVQCSLAPSGQLDVQMAEPHPQPVGAGIVTDAWAQLLRQLFFAVTCPLQQGQSTGVDADSQQRLRQRFIIPGTDLSTEAVAIGLSLRHGYLVALYAIPSNEQRFNFTLEEKKPEPTIVQPVIPPQATSGASVTTQLIASLADSPHPPYDYAWCIDRVHQSRAHQSPIITVTKTPTSTVMMDGPQKLATVTLKVIDILGQVGEAEVDATYYPAKDRQDKQQKSIHDTAINATSAGTTTAADQLYEKPKKHRKQTVISGLVLAAAILCLILFIAFIIPKSANFIGPSENSAGVNVNNPNNGTASGGDSNVTPQQPSIGTGWNPTIEGDWTLHRTLVSCTNFPEGCQAGPIKVQISNCSPTQCTISRTDGVWQSSHLIRQASGNSGEWEAGLYDTAVTCHGTTNPATVLIQFTITSTQGNGVSYANTGSGSYTVQVTTNPPDCDDNGYAVWNISGVRS